MSIFAPINEKRNKYDCKGMQQEENIVESERAKAKRLAHSFLGAFSASRTDEDWKKVKEDYLVSKYMTRGQVSVSR